MRGRWLKIENKASEQAITGGACDPRIVSMEVTLWLLLACITMSLSGCGGGPPRAYFYESLSGDRFYETTAQKVEQVTDGQQVRESQVPVILWVTTKGEVVDITAAVGTTRFTQGAEFPVRESSEEQSRLLWALEDTNQGNAVEQRDITSFMVKKVPWDAVKQDWDLSGFDIAPETGRCRPLTLNIQGPGRDFLGIGGPPSKDPSMKRRNCLHLMLDIPLKIMVMSPPVMGALVMGPFLGVR
ncbi:MAG: hypothetical protein ACREIL_06430 [Nitrospiraceae bacterium]